MMTSRNEDQSGKVPYQVMLAYALKTIGRRRLTERQLRDKIVEHFTKKIDQEVVVEDIDKVIEEMRTSKFIDDLDFATLFIQDTMQRRPHGRMWVQMELARKGVDRDTIADALGAYAQASSGEEEMNALRDAAQKKWDSLTGREGRGGEILEPRKRYEKMFRFLVSRGFSTSMVVRVLDEISGKSV